jgi:CheY-like chemotaxis protein
MAFERAGLGKSVQAVRGGFEAMAYLNGEPPYHDREKYPFPALVLLDIKMAGMDGFEVLKRIRSHASLAGLCVVMLTSSDQIQDANRAYQSGANSFLVKPLDFWNVEELMRSLERLLQGKR